MMATILAEKEEPPKETLSERNITNDSKNEATDLCEEGDDDLMDMCVPSGMVILNDAADSGGYNRPPQKPAENKFVDDRAILDCWNILVASHEASIPFSDATADVSSSSTYCWRAKDKEVFPDDAKSPSDLLQGWRPKPLNLPVWAIDPSEMNFVMGQSSSNNNHTREDHQNTINR